MRSIVAAATLAAVLTACSGDDKPAVAPARETSATTAEPVAYSDPEWHWAQGWCSDSLGGIEGVPLWDSADSWPEGFDFCVETQLPAAKAGLAEGLRPRGNTTPQETYCIDSAPPAVANNYDRSWKAFDRCLADEFGIES